MSNIGILDYKLIKKYGLSGVLARSSGFYDDLRVSKPYECYKSLPIPGAFSTKGDNLDRFLLRIEETFISIYYMANCLLPITLAFKLNSTELRYKDQQHFKYPELSCFNSDNIKNNKELFETTIKKMSHSYKAFDKKVHYSMEYIISEFISYSKMSLNISGRSNVFIESPKGSFGLSLISNGHRVGKFPRPNRLKVRSPGFFNLASLNEVSSGHSIADMLSYLSTLDLILGEVDR